MYPNQTSFQSRWSHSPRGGRVQFTDLVLGVLAQFPESPDRCHPDRLRGDETRITKHTTTQADRATSVEEDKEWRGFKALPPLRTVRASLSLLSVATPLNAQKSL